MQARLWRLWPRPRCLHTLASSFSLQSHGLLNSSPALSHDAPLLSDSNAWRKVRSATAAGPSGPWNLHVPTIHSLQLQWVLPFVDRTAIQQLVVTASGPDRPGIVARLAKRVLECGGNVAESRIARLAGDFTILMLITFDVTSCSKPWTGVCRTARKAEQLQNSLLQIEGLQVSTRWTSDERERETQPLRKFRRISLHGADNPGLVYNVTEYLFGHGINIENLETHTEEAPFGGTTLFMMEGLIAMPVKLSTSKLIHNLDTLQTTLGVDITISNIPIPAHHKFHTASPAQSIV